MQNLSDDLEEFMLNLSDDLEEFDDTIDEDLDWKKFNELDLPFEMIDIGVLKIQEQEAENIPPPQGEEDSLHGEKIDGGEEVSPKKDEELDQLKVPPGYRFCPTDYELVKYYLIEKILHQTLPWNLIAEVNVYDYTPEFLAEQYRQYGENKWYFFTQRERKYPNGKRPKRAAGDGFWKATGADKKITTEDEIEIGLKKTLVFYKGEPTNGVKTNWIMHEYRVNGPPRTKMSESDMVLDDCVLCRIYKRMGKKGSKNRFQDKDHPVVACPTSSHEHMENFNGALVDPIVDGMNYSHSSLMQKDDMVPNKRRKLSDAN